MSTLQVQPVARKVTALRWLPPHGGSAYTDTELHFVTGSSGKHKELVLWTTPNPDFSNTSESNSDIKTNALATVISKIPHDGDVQKIVSLSSGVLATASSFGTVSIYSVDTETNAKMDNKGAVGLRESVAAHKFCNGEAAVATSLAVQPAGSNNDVEMASCGEDGRVSYINASRPDALQSYEVDSTVVTDICWPTAAQVAISTRGGQLKLFDRRSPNTIAAVFVDPSASYAFESINVHPSQSHRLVTGTNTGAVLLWDVRNPRKPTNENFNVHEGNVWQVAFDPKDATRIVSCSEDASMAVTQWVPEGSIGGGATALGVAPEKTRGVRRLSSMFNALSINCFDACPFTRTNLLIAGSDSGNLLMEKGVNSAFGDF